MAFNQTEKQEKEYLKQIISFLKKVIGNTDASVKDHVDTLAEYKDYIWSNKDIDPHEIRSMSERREERRKRGSNTAAEETNPKAVNPV